MYFDTLNNEQQVSYLIKPIIEVLQEAGGQLERSEIRDRISEKDEHIAEFEQKICKRQIGPILKERSLCEIIEPQGGRIFMPGTSKVDWMHMFEEQESSNLSISQYCKLHGISDKAFYNARSRYKKTVETPSLVAVEVNDDIGFANTGCISFKLNGMSFEFDESAPDSDIQRIIKICLSL